MAKLTIASEESKMMSKNIIISTAFAALLAFMPSRAVALESGCGSRFTNLTTRISQMELPAIDALNMPMLSDVVAVDNSRRYTSTGGSDDGFFSRGRYRGVAIAIPVLATSALFYVQDEHYRAIRNTYAPTFRHSYDDYLQYSPAALMFALKLSGVESRSSWGRMLVADLASVAVTTALVNGLKYTVRRPRPDTGTRNSFPSGHTATAFMAATLLHKEYGLTRSPWYSLAGYGLATATAVSRSLNNRHWVSDVIAGAGIGILSAELGYLIADAIFKERGILREVKSVDAAWEDFRPSFVSIDLGLIDSFTLDSGRNLSKGGPGTAVEGAWFLTPRWGVGGMLTARQSPLRIDTQLYDRLPSGFASDAAPLVSVGVSAGIYYSYPVGRWFFSGKTLAGVNRNHTNRTTLYATSTDTTPFATVIFDNNFRFMTSLGGSIGYLVNPRLMFRAFGELSYVRQRYVYQTQGADGQQFARYNLPVVFGISIVGMLR